MAHTGPAQTANSAEPSASSGPGQSHSAGQENWQQWHGTVFTNAKAGMTGVDKEFVKKVVYEMSKVQLL
jgi:hypothetical protein